MIKRGLWSGVLMFALISPIRTQAGGSGLNVAVIVNQSSTNSLQVGNYYCEKRQVPPQNVLLVNWPGSVSDWTKAEFESVVLNPLLAMLSARQLTNQIDYVVLCMDLPYRVFDSSTNSYNSSTSDLFYGFKPDDFGDSCSLPAVSESSYAFSEGIFRLSTPGSATTNSFLAMLITSSTLAQAKAVIDQGVASDGGFPTQRVLLGHSTDPFRNVRYWVFDDAIFNVRLRGNYSIQPTNCDTPLGLSNLLGYQNGHATFTISPNTFVPGAIADSLTSYGGSLFDSGGQTTLLAFLGAGATAGYGTVVEPCNYLEKFPSPQNYFYQARGFSLAESYYQSVANPYQGLMVGEPLAAPFAKPASVSWNNLPTGAVLNGVTNLSLQVTAADAQRPVQQVDLFLDGTFLQTITNIAPPANNVLSVTLNGVPTNYTVPPGATLQSIASNLTVRLNQPGYSSATKIAAANYGDRIELQSSDITRKGLGTPVSVSSSLGSGSFLGTYVSSRTNLLDTSAYGTRSFFVTNVPQAGDFLQVVVTKTNGQVVTVSATNNSGLTIAQLCKTLFDRVNTNAVLQAADGIVIQDIVMTEDYVFAFGPNNHSGYLDMHPRSPGWAESQIQVRIQGSPTFGIQPAGNNLMDEKLADLQPRGHIYVTAGVTNLPLSFPLNTAGQPDGFHELTAVAYEGSHVRTQKRAASQVRFQNGTLSAVFTTLFGGSNTVLGATLHFSVVANTNNISKIELFSLGGSMGSVTGQSNALFSVAGTNLGLGLHPFYALVTGTNGKQYRTETRWIRLIGAESPFPLSVSSPPVTLAWPSTAGRGYEILSATSVTNPFVVRDGLTPTNSAARWAEPSVGAPRFYKVRSTN